MSVWTSLPKLGLDEAKLLRDAARGFGARRPDPAAWERLGRLVGGALELTWEGVVAGDLAARMPPHWVAALVGDARGVRGAVILDGRWARALAARVLGAGGDDLPAPRALTPAEEGAIAYAVAAALIAFGIDGLAVTATTVDAAALAGTRWAAAHAVARMGDTVGPVLVAVTPAVLAAAAAAAAAAAPPRASDARLDAVDVTLDVVVGGTQLTRAELAALAPGDAVILDFHLDGVALAGDGGALYADRALTVSTRYAHVDLMAKHLGEPADALRVPLTARLGQLTLSAREILDLTPGSVLPLGRPVGTHVELVNAGHVVARGDLVDIDGELAVQITDVSAG